MRWAIAISMLPVFAYGLLNIFIPRTTFAWQVRSTARHGERDPRSFLGTAVQRWLGIDPNDQPGRAVLNRIRGIGLVEVAISVAIVAAMLYAGTS